MNIQADYHMHTPRCKHAAGPMEAYVERGIALGLREIGFSDHNPLPGGRGAGVRMDERELDDYVADVLRLRERYRGAIEVRLGIEMDYVTGLEEYLAEQAARHPWDYVIGSVHYLDPDCRQGAWPRNVEGGVAAVYARYYAQVRRLAAAGFYDIVAHFDLPKRSGHRAPPEVEADVDETLEALRKADLCLEINTSGLLHKEQGEAPEPYPAHGIVASAVALGIPLTVNSDSHSPDRVGNGFEQVGARLDALDGAALARFAGRRRTLYGQG